MVLKCGDIRAEPADAIVCSTDAQLKNDVGLARAFINQAGKTVQDECEKWIENFGQPKVGACAITAPGNISTARHLVFTVGPDYNSLPEHDAKQERMKNQIRMCVYTVLDALRSMEVRSIAISPISTGHYGFPVDLCAKSMIRSIIEWAHARKEFEQGSIEEISLIQLDRQQHTEFQNQLREINNSSRARAN